MTFVPIIESFLKARHYKAVQPLAALIDMDGTLYDSMGNHARAWQRMVQELGIECSYEEFFMHEGRTGAATIDLIFERVYGRKATSQEHEEYYQRKATYFTQMPPVEVMPGAQAMISTLMEAGVRRVLVTGSGQSSLINRLDADFPGAFPAEMRVTSRDVTKGKPHPEPYMRAMQIARVRPSQCIAIENAPLGVKSAVDAGAFTVAVTTGPIPYEEMEKAGATVIFPSMEDFAQKLPMLLFQLLTTTIE